jgi:hypothetical protein
LGQKIILTMIFNKNVKKNNQIFLSKKFSKIYLRLYIVLYIIYLDFTFFIVFIYI